MKIETSVDEMNRWQAWVDGTLDGGETNVRGQGDSEQDAVEDLLERVEAKR